MNDMSNMQLKSPTLTSTMHLKKRLTTPSIFNQIDRNDNFNFELTKKSLDPRYYITTNDRSVDTTGRLMKLNEIDENASKLLINIVNSLVLGRCAKLLITPRGLLNSLRNKKDGIVYFGALNDPDNARNDYVTNEILDMSRLPSQDTSTEPHYRIMFDPALMKYFIKDLGHGCGCFLKLKNEMILASTSLINIGNTFLVISFDVISNEYLNIKVFSHILKLNSNNYFISKNTITIGRDQECDIMIDDPMLSRVHCTVFLYNEGGERKFGVRDGSKSNTDDLDFSLWKNSTNGTWFYLSEDYEIYDGLIYKAHNTIFKVSEYFSIN